MDNKQAQEVCKEEAERSNMYYMTERWLGGTLTNFRTIRKELIAYIFDKIRNDGKAFEFNFYDPSIKKSKVGRVKLVDGHIRDGQVRYFITAEGIEFYLDTKEIKEESKINVEQLLLEKMITGENFKGGIEVVKRINNEVNRLVREKDEIVDMFSYDVFKAAERYEKYMKTVGNWFMEEQKMFARNKALVDKADELGEIYFAKAHALRRRAVPDSLRILLHLLCQIFLLSPAHAL